MFSTTTIALSTSIPSARMSENRTTMFIVKPRICITLNERNIDSGMAIPTNEAFRTPRTNSSTATTRIRPEMMLFSRLLTISRTYFAWSDVMLTTVVGGKSPSISAITARTASDVSMMFSPVRLLTLSVTTGLPLSRA